jgi:hypothetical protein
VIELLTDAAVTRKVQPAGNLTALAGLIEGDAAACDARQRAAIRLAAAWSQRVAGAAAARYK